VKALPSVKASLTLSSRVPPENEILFFVGLSGEKFMIRTARIKMFYYLAPFLEKIDPGIWSSHTARPTKAYRRNRMERRARLS
jgi:hypothetical protein